jgi:sodium-dependent dicarboxylate transporter 2/3/5
VGFVLGVALFVAVLLAPRPGSLEPAAWHTAAVGLLMATWWITEAIPISATALVPLVLFPLLGVADIRVTARPYAHPLIFLFLGGFMIAAAMQRWGLPRRIALQTIRLIGTRPTSIILGVMVACAFLSMWVSNSATALTMLPIGTSLTALLNTEMKARPSAAPATQTNFGTALMLGIAYGCTIGGLATLIGTPPNAFLAAFVSDSYGITIGFAEWMLLGIPLVAVGLPLAYLILTRLLFRIETASIPGGEELIRRELQRMGPMSSSERRVLAVFAMTASLWMLRPILSRWVPALSDAGIAMLGALLLFLIPSHRRSEMRLLDWASAERVPWGVLVLFGGGLSLAGGIQSSGLTGWIGTAFVGLADWPAWLLVLAVVAVIILLTELTSNTATAAAFLPVTGSVAIGIGLGPLMLTVPAALGASGAFMLPVATPPNAIVYGSGAVSIPQMVRAGILLNLLFLVLITVAAILLMPLVFGS